jgi:mannose-6-phosphate isomerase-like protein (cupin superfamily)
MTMFRWNQLCVVSILLLNCSPALSAEQQEPTASKPRLVGGGPPQHPADPRVFISGDDVLKRIAEDDALVAAGQMTNGEPLVMQGPFRATMEWRNTGQNNVNLHQTDAEIFVIIEGSGTMLLGGTLVDPKQAKGFAWEGPTLTAAKVEGAVPYKVKKGDMIMIPPNTPHTVSEVNGKMVLWSMHLPMPPGTAPSSLSNPVTTR